jgi:hypothetical protein
MTGPAQRMNTANYDAWEADMNEFALTRSQELIDYYNDGYKCIEFTIEQSKESLAYVYMKIWHILDGSGIFLDYTIRKIKGKCRVTLQLYPTTEVDASA